MSMSRRCPDEGSWLVNLVKAESISPVLFTERTSAGLGYIYEGERNANGQPHGQGNMKFENGDYYSGSWFKGKLHGSASAKILVDVDSNNYKAYKGEFQNGKQHGFGKFTWPDGEFYEGHWLNGLFHGHGIYCTPDGVSTQYSFSKGLPEIGSTCQVAAPRHRC
jgi:hypothetical protein